MDNLGISTYDRNPIGSENGRIGVDAFVAEA